MFRPAMGEHGQGTTWAFTEKRKDGTLRHRVRVGVTVNGKRVWRTAKDAKDAERIRRELIEARELDLDPTRQTLEGYLRSWIASQRELARKGRGLRVRTLNGYEKLIEQRILPGLGSVTLARLSKRRIQSWLDGQDGSAGTIRNAHAVLRKALEQAAGDIIPSNPAKGVELPKRERFEGSPMTEDEVRRLLAATEGDWLHPLWRLAVVTGLREGELLGLPREALEVNDEAVRGSWTGRDVPLGAGPRGLAQGELPRMAERGGLAGTMGEDWAAAHGRADAGALSEGDGVRAGRAGTLTVDRELVRIGGRWAFDKPKAARSLKRLALDEGTVEVLRKHLSQLAAVRKPSWRYFGLMFVTPQGQPYHQSTVLAEFRKACEKAGIGSRRFHDLRHTANRLLEDRGVNEAARMARLGHSTTRMSRHYGGGSDEMDRQAADVMAKVIGG